MQVIIRRGGMWTVRLARRLLARTRVRQWPLTARLYRVLMLALYQNRDRTIVYKGLNLLIPGRDCAISPGLIGGFYEALELDAFALACAGRQCVLDIGANIGVYTVQAARHVEPGGTVHAFEPVPVNRFFLVHNIAGNGATGVRVVGLAVGAGEGPLTLHIDDRDSATHSAAPLATSRRRTVVWMTTVDAYVIRQRLTVDVIKVDITGYDAHALRGAAGILLRDRPTVFVEYAPQPLRRCGSTVDDVIGPLRGYRYGLTFDEVRRQIRPVDLDQLTVGTKPVSLMVTDDVQLYHAVLARTPVAPRTASAAERG